MVNNPVNAMPGGLTVHEYTINNDDPAGAIRLSKATYSVGEAGKQVTITAMRVGGSSGAVGVSYETSDGTATAGSDYTSIPGVLAWADGDKANKNFTILIANDTLDEAIETFTMKLTAPTGGAILSSPSVGTGTITDNDPTPKVRFSQATSSGVESATPARITVTLSAESGQTVSVKYATANGSALAGGDYTETSGTLIFTPGQTSGTIDVPIVDNAAVEPDQTFTVLLKTPVNATLGAPSRHVCTITNDDVGAPDKPSSDAHPETLQGRRR